MQEPGKSRDRSLKVKSSGVQPHGCRCARAAIAFLVSLLSYHPPGAGFVPFPVQELNLESIDTHTEQPHCCRHVSYLAPPLLTFVSPSSMLPSSVSLSVRLV